MAAQAAAWRRLLAALLLVLGLREAHGAAAGILCYGESSGGFCNALRPYMSRDEALAPIDALFIARREHWSDPQLAALDARRALSCHLHRNGSETAGRCALLEASPTGVVQMGEALDTAGAAGHEVTGLALATLGDSGAAALCMTAGSRGVVCRVLRPNASSLATASSLAAGGLAGGLEDDDEPVRNIPDLEGGERVLAVTVPVRRLALTPLGFGAADGIVLCFEDMSEDPVAILRCAVLLVRGLEMSLPLEMPFPIRVRPPADSGILDPLDLEPGSQRDGRDLGSRTVRYDLSLAPMSKDIMGAHRVMLCYGVEGLCDQGLKCAKVVLHQGHFCEALATPSAVDLSLAFLPGRPRVARAGGIRYPQVTTFGDPTQGRATRCIFCFEAAEMNRERTICALVKGVEFVIQWQHSIVVAGGKVASLVLAALPSGALVCSRQKGAVGRTTCKELLYNRRIIDGVETISEASSAEIGNANYMALALVEVGDRSIVVEEDTDLWLKTEVQIGAGTLVVVMAGFVGACIAIRCCFRGTTVCARWLGFEPPPAPEVEVAANVAILNI